jgi:hypothetical protein
MSTIHNLKLVNRALCRSDSLLSVMSSPDLWRAVRCLIPYLTTISDTHDTSSSDNSSKIPWDSAAIAIGNMTNGVIKSINEIEVRLKMRRNLSKVHNRGLQYFDHFTWSYLFKLHSHHPNTSTWLIHDIDSWLASSNQIGSTRLTPVKTKMSPKNSPNSKGSPGKNRLHSSCVWHICGESGTGKSTVCAALVDSLQADGTLLASIFCNDTDRSSTVVMNIVKSIAVQASEALSKHSHIFQAAFSSLRGDETCPVDVFKTLVIDTLIQINLPACGDGGNCSNSSENLSALTGDASSSSSSSRSLFHKDYKVIVLDCIDAFPLGSIERAQILDILQYCCGILVLPHWVKIVIASRPDVDVAGVVALSVPPARVEMLCAPRSDHGNVPYDNARDGSSFESPDKAHEKMRHIEMFGNDRFMGDVEMVLKNQLLITLDNYCSNKLTFENTKIYYMPSEATYGLELSGVFPNVPGDSSVPGSSQARLAVYSGDELNVDVDGDRSGTKGRPGGLMSRRNEEDGWIENLVQDVVTKGQWSYAYNSLLFDVCVPKILKSFQGSEPWDENKVRNEVKRAIQQLPSGYDELLCWLINDIVDDSPAMLENVYIMSCLQLLVAMPSQQIPLSHATCLIKYLALRSDAAGSGSGVGGADEIMQQAEIEAENTTDDDDDDDEVWITRKILKPFQDLVKVMSVQGVDCLMPNYSWTSLTQWADRVTIVNGHVTLLGESEMSSQGETCSLLNIAIAAISRFTSDVYSMHYRPLSPVITLEKPLERNVLRDYSYSAESLMFLQCMLHHTLPALLHHQQNYLLNQLVASKTNPICFRLPSFVDNAYSDQVFYWPTLPLSICLNISSLVDIVSSPHSAGGVDGMVALLQSMIFLLKTLIRCGDYSAEDIISFPLLALHPNVKEKNSPSDAHISYSIQDVLQSLELVLEFGVLSYPALWNRHKAVRNCPQQLIARISPRICRRYPLMKQLVQQCEVYLSAEGSTSSCVGRTDMAITKWDLIDVPSSLGGGENNFSVVHKNWQPLQGSLRVVGGMEHSALTLYHPEVDEARCYLSCFMTLL